MKKTILLLFLLASFNAFANTDCVSVVVENDNVRCAFDISGLIESDTLENHLINGNQIHEYLLKKSKKYAQHYKGVPTIYVASRKVDLEWLVGGALNPLQDGGGSVTGGGVGKLPININPDALNPYQDNGDGNGGGGGAGKLPAMGIKRLPISISPSVINPLQDNGDGNGGGGGAGMVSPSGA